MHSPPSDICALRVPLTLIRLGGGKVYPPSRTFSSVRAMSIRAPRATPHKKVNDMRQLLGEKKFQNFFHQGARRRVKVEIFQKPISTTVKLANIKKFREKKFSFYVFFRICVFFLVSTYFFELLFLNFFWNFFF